MDLTDAKLCGWLSALALVPRLVYTSAMELAPYDPWRHLLLIRNLREGLGFAFTGEEPYIWYQPLWYVICAAAPAWLGPEWIATLCSWLCVPAIYVLLRRMAPEASRVAPAAAAALTGLYGPFTHLTCHYGAEAFAMLLMLVALVLFHARQAWPETLAAGLLFGLALVARLNYAFTIFLFLPVLRRLPRALAFGAGMATPLALAWWRNSSVIRDHAWVFTWDGLATPARGFDPLSTLVIQLHPDVGEGLRRLHDTIRASPEWIEPGGQLVLILVTLASVAIARRPGPALAIGSTLAYFLLLDSSGTGRFFRIWVGVFPAMFISLALAAERWATAGRRLGKGGAALLVGAILVAGAEAWTPPRGAAVIVGSRHPIPLEQVTPPPDLLREDRYMVNSGFFQPESLIYRYPDKQFIGLPLRPETFEAFRREFPTYDAVLWHDVSVQDDLLAYLLGPGGYRQEREATNAHGLRYRVLLASPASPRDDAERRVPQGGPAAPDSAEPAPLPPRGEMEHCLSLIRAGQFESARARLLPIVAAHPGWQRAMFLLGLSYHEEGRHAEARPLFARALALDATSPDAQALHLHQGWTLLQLGETEGAREQFEQLLVARPDYAEGHFALGLLDFDRDDLASAGRRFRRAIDLAHQAGDARVEGKARARLADVLVRSDDLARAREELEAAVRLRPDAYEAYFKLSRVLERLGDAEGAARARERHDALREQARPQAPLP